MRIITAVAVGGAVGSVGRYLTMSGIGQWVRTDWPLGTLTVNVVGSLIMGIIVELAALIWSPSPELRAFLTVGVLGGFTTFSAFSLDVALLIERHQVVAAAAYVVASVLASVAALFFGMAVVRQVLT